MILTVTLVFTDLVLSNVSLRRRTATNRRFLLLTNSHIVSINMYVDLSFKILAIRMHS